MKSKGSALAVKNTINFDGRIYSCEKPLLMGIMNLTPDSFYAGSRTSPGSHTVETARSMIADGVDILDIGGYSSRPGAAHIEEQEELDRVIPTIQSLRKEFPELVISIDTFRAAVVSAAISAGANMVNDISGGELDEAMFSTVARLKVPYVLMHMRGTPINMKEMTHYDDLIIEITEYFIQKIDQLRSLGVKDIIIDPGIGFAKTIGQNFELLRHLSYFQHIGCPILIGVSRKSMIYKSLDIAADQALNGTTALNMAALLQGAGILRVHDVKESKETVRLFNLLIG